MYNRRMKRINIHLTDKQIKELKDLSKATGLSVAELIRRSVDRFLRSVKRG